MVEQKGNLPPWQEREWGVSSCALSLPPSCSQGFRKGGRNLLEGDSEDVSAKNLEREEALGMPESDPQGRESLWWGGKTAEPIPIDPVIDPFVGPLFLMRLI